jgi:acetyl esterase
MAQENPVLDHTIREFLNELEANAGPPVYQLTPDEARSTLLRAQSGPVRKPEAQIKDWNVVSAVGTLRLRTIRPNIVRESSPVILYFHGGGWVMGDATTHDRLVREFAVGADVTVVFVDYDRAPEHRYPVAIEQAYAAACYVSEHAEEFGVDSTRLAVAGESSGGNMATVVSLLAKQRSGPRIAGQLLLYPVTNANFETVSYQQFADGPWLTRLAMQWFWDQYLPDHSSERNQLLHRCSHR